MNAPSVKYAGLQERILNFLGAGIAPERVASAVGCEPSYISQLLSDEEFAKAVSQQKIVQLTELTERDKRLDTIEDRVIDKVEQSLKSPMALLKPMEGIRALQMINSLKRRGSNVDNNVNNTSVSVNIVLPSITLKQFTVDVNNQVIKADDDSLVTIASSQVAQLAPIQENTNDYAKSKIPSIPSIPSITELD
jgi:hypothetical protein